jgi:hypothetical protein
VSESNSRNALRKSPVKSGPALAGSSGRSEGTGAALLGIYGIGSSRSPQPAPEFDPGTGEVRLEGWSYEAALVERYALQAQARRAMLEAWRRDGSKGKAHGVTRCRRWLRPRGKFKPVYAEVHRHADTGRTFFTGTEICGSPWACSVCSAKIAQRRADEIRAAVDRWISEGGVCLFVTLTFPHARFDALAPMVQRFRRALELFRGGRGGAAINAALGRVGVIRALEITWGELNGWHPHSHEIWFCRPSVVPLDAIVERWADSAESAGLARPSWAHGVRLDVVRSTEQASAALAEYCAKLGRDMPEDGRPLWGAAEELTRAHSKRGRLARFTPWDFLRAQFDPEASPAARVRYRGLFAEYVQAFGRVAQLFWSRGLKARFDIEDKSDAKTAEESREAADSLARIEADQWERLFVRADHRPTVLLLAQRGGSAVVRPFIESLPSPPPGDTS